MPKTWNQSLWLAAATVAMAGCGSQSGTAPPQPVPQAASQYLLVTEPDGARGVAEMRQAAEDGQAVVVVGRIGGQSDPWVEGAAAMMLIDTSLVPCNERPGDQCPTPWDYCCESPSDLNASKVLVTFVDSEGRLIQTGVQELLGVQELQTVVVRGRARRDAAGNVSVLADGLFVR